MKLTVEVRGCDDSTYVNVDIDAVQMETVCQLAEKINSVGGGCKPTMDVFLGHLAEDHGSVEDYSQAFVSIVEDRQGQP